MDIPKQMSKTSPLLALCAGLTLCGTANSNELIDGQETVDVSVEVVSTLAECAVNGMEDVDIGSVLVGEVIPLVGGPGAEDEFTISCTVESVAGVQVSHDGGLNASGNSPRMTNGTDFISYLPRIRQGSAGPRTTLYTSTNANMGAIPAGESQFEMHYDLSYSQTIPSSLGTYTDTLTFTFDF